MLANFVIAFYTEELLTYKNLQNLKCATIYIHNYTQPFFFKGRFYYKINKTQHKKLQLFTKYVQTHHHKDFKHCTS